jgi:hypothetical protein
VGVLRYGLNWSLREVQTVLYRTLNLPRLAFSTLSYLAIEYLVRWTLFAEERLKEVADRLGGWVLQVDGTLEDGGPTTLRAREGRTGVTLLARQVVSENEEDVVAFLEEVRARYGIPVLIVRDDGKALKSASHRVFPGTPQQLDPYHFLVNAAKRLVKDDHEALKRGLTGDEGLAKIVEWARTLPCRARETREVLSVVARLAVEDVNEARRHAGGFPFHRAYQEVRERIEWVRTRVEEVIHANARNLRVDLAVLGELKGRLDRLVGREAVRVAWGHLAPEARAFEGIREALKMERDRRKGGAATVAFMAHDVTEAKRRMAEEGARLCAVGEHETAKWVKFEEMLREQEPYLWPPAGIEERWTTVELERAHHHDRAAIRGRTRQASTGEEMGRMGWLLATGSNVENPWFVANGVMGRNLWSEFAEQDWDRVKGKMAKVGREGLRERVPVGRKRARGVLEEAMKILTEGGSKMECKLERWADLEGLLETPESATLA